MNENALSTIYHIIQQSFILWIYFRERERERERALTGQTSAEMKQRLVEIEVVESISVKY